MSEFISEIEHALVRLLKDIELPPKQLPSYLKRNKKEDIDPKEKINSRIAKSTMGNCCAFLLKDKIA